MAYPDCGHTLGGCPELCSERDTRTEVYGTCSACAAICTDEYEHDEWTWCQCEDRQCVCEGLCDRELCPGCQCTNDVGDEYVIVCRACHVLRVTEED